MRIHGRFSKEEGVGEQKSLESTFRHTSLWTENGCVHSANQLCDVYMSRDDQILLGVTPTDLPAYLSCMCSRNWRLLK
jgi:hypothetical protein